jgi:adenosylhomocysteine nucleosidase
VEKGEILLANKTVIYDIYEKMGDAEEHLNYYKVDVDLQWLSKPYPLNVRTATILSGDRDLIPEDITDLMNKYHTFAGDWESGAIAWVAARNHTDVLILRGVSDLIDHSGGEAYDGNIDIFYENTNRIMNDLLDSLPGWIKIYKEYAIVLNQKNI